MTVRAFLLFILSSIASAAYALPACQQAGYDLGFYGPPNARTGWYAVTAVDLYFRPVCVMPRFTSIYLYGNRESFCSGFQCYISVWDWDWNGSGQPFPNRVMFPRQSINLVGPW